MVERSDIQFESEGLVCRGWLFRPSAEGRRPCVVMAHGFCGVKEMRLDAYAGRFAQEGYAALVFDYRHFGASEGEPRQVLDIGKQHRDWHRAIACARSLAGVDPDRIVLWGSSFSGGHVLAVAVEDGRTAAVISQVPHMDGLSTALAAGPVHNLRLAAASLRDRAGRILGREPVYVPAFGRPGDLAAMTAAGELEASRRLFPADTAVREDVAARVFLSLAGYSPCRKAPRLKVPWLVQVALKDRTTPPGPAMKAARKAPLGELVAYPVGHFDVYVEPGFHRTVGDQLRFLKRHLG